MFFFNFIPFLEGFSKNRNINTRACRKENTMRTIAVEPTRLEACAGQIEQLRQEVERAVARLYERVELMAANTWIGRDNLAFTTQIQGYQDDFRRSSC